MRAALLLISLAFAAPIFAAEPAPGDTRAAVEAELGKATATRTTPADDLVAVYPRGTVTYRAGRATELKIIPRAEWLARLEAEKKAVEEKRLRLARQAEERARRVAEAAKVRDTLLASEAFKQLSPEGRIARLDALLAEHPEADVAALREDLARAVATSRIATKRAEDERLAREAADRQLAEHAARLEEMKQLLAAVATRAEDAEKRLAQAEKDLKGADTRMKIMEEVIRTRVLSQGTGISLGTGIAGSGHSDTSGPSH